ncbi:hypothetical protein EDB19DRAFT_638107 [Suillus lakei]|nr:hypothetical protein EDB19DRAFT_638107 [Suillus lakei]
MDLLAILTPANFASAACAGCHHRIPMLQDDTQGLFYTKPITISQTIRPPQTTLPLLMLVVMCSPKDSEGGRFCKAV